MASLFTWTPGYCSTSFTHADEPLILPTKSGLKRAFSSIIEDCTPPCRLNPFLFNGHLQTAWTAVKAEGPPIHYKRRVFSAADPAFAGTFAVDFVTAPPKPHADKTASDGGPEDAGLREDPTGVGHVELPPRTTYFTDLEFESLPASDAKPLLIVLHGLSGGSHEIYLRHVIAPLVAETTDGARSGISGGEWEALVVNSRGCAGSRITTSILYNARATWDVRQVVQWARKIWPNRPLYGIGFSLGANILTNYLGEERSDCLLNAACIVSNPCKLEVSSLNLKRTWLGQNVYSRAMGTSMKKLYDTHKDVISQNKALLPAQIDKVKYLYEFDREVQCATWGYPTETAYYRDATSADSIFSIRIPTFMLHAKDDPIACDEAAPYDEVKQTPWVVMCATSGGGHLSWFELGGGRWFAKPACNFLNAMRDVDFDKIETPPSPGKGPRGGHKTPFVFEPMRRKLHLPDSPQRSSEIDVAGTNESRIQNAK